MSDELTIKKERVLEAAEQCSDARSILKTLFPEAFEKTTKNITDKLESRIHGLKYNDDDLLVRIDIYHHGELVGHVRNTGIEILNGYEIKKLNCDFYFQIWKK